MIAPATPKVPTQLSIWEEDAESVLEIDQAHVKDVTLANLVKLYVDASKLEQVTLTGAVVDKLECTDVVGLKLEASAMRAYKAQFLRVSLTDCRLTGAEFAESNFEDCTFMNIKLDEVGFRFASLKRVKFVNCVLRQADFSNAKLAHVTFSGCDLEGVNFTSAICNDVDITTEDLTLTKGILGLKGATISHVQLMQLAPLLASELGFHVKD